MASSFNSVTGTRGGEPVKDIGPVLRGVMMLGTLTLATAATIALVKGLTGLAPTMAEAREVAVGIHLAAVLPAVPLGLYVLLRRKGDRRHRMLGALWMLLMLVTAISALFIRHINGGGFSVIHLFVPLVLVTVVRSIAAARAGRIGSHKKQLVNLFLLGLILPGLFSFVPGRIMWTWLVG